MDIELRNVASGTPGGCSVTGNSGDPFTVNVWNDNLDARRTAGKDLKSLEAANSIKIWPEWNNIYIKQHNKYKSIYAGTQDYKEICLDKGTVVLSEINQDHTSR